MRNSVLAQRDRVGWLMGAIGWGYSALKIPEEQTFHWIIAAVCVVMLVIG